MNARALLMEAIARTREEMVTHYRAYLRAHAEDDHEAIRKHGELFQAAFLRFERLSVEAGIFRSDGRPPAGNA